MSVPNRRTFLKSTVTAGAFLQTAAGSPKPAEPERVVSFVGDGIAHSPVEYARLLTQLADAGAKSDSYLKGGAVEELESRFAAILNKERAVFFPTGTLANHVAVRVLAGDRRRVLVQEESHVYRDESDCAQLLSGLNLIALAPGRATIKAAEIAEALDRTAAPPYPVPVGAISIESPVRRTHGQSFDFEEMKQIAAMARKKEIGLHLDGARMFLASAYTGVSPAEYSLLFDTVYVSLYKYFNAPFGAVLAGPRALMEAAATIRHPFGGGLLHAWEPAAVALHFLDGFEQRYRQAVQRGNEVLRALEQKGVRVQRLPAGTNIFGLELPPAKAQGLQDRLAGAGIRIAKPPSEGPLWIQINETINRRPSAEIAAELIKALA